MRLLVPRGISSADDSEGLPLAESLDFSKFFASIAAMVASIGRGSFANGVLTPSAMQRATLPPREGPRRAPGGQLAKIFTKKGFS